MCYFFKNSYIDQNWIGQSKMSHHLFIKVCYLTGKLFWGFFYLFKIFGEKMDVASVTLCVGF